MQTGRLKAAAFLLSLGCAPAWSANILSIYQDALAKDAELAASKARLESQRETQEQAFSGLLPQVSLNASYTDTTSETDLGDNDSEVSEWNVTGRQVLFDGNTWNTWEASKQALVAAEYTYNSDIQDLTLRASTAYIELLRAHENLTLRIAEEKAVGRQLEQTKQHFEVGLIPITDVHEAQASFDDTRVNRIVAQNDLNIAFEELTKLTGQAYANIDGLSKDFPITMPVPEGSQSWVDKAIANNPSLAASNAAVLAAQEELDSSKSGHYPTIDLTATYQDQSVDADDPMLDGSDPENTIIALNFTLPLYAGGGVSASVRQATSDLEESRQDLIFANRTITQQTRTLYSLVTTNVLRIDARKQAVVSSTSALEATELGYEVGTRNIVDVLIAQSNLYESQRNLANARYDYILNLFQLKLVAGELAQADIEGLNQWLTGAQITTVEVTKNL